MQFIDLVEQQHQHLPDGRTIREAVDARIASVLNHGRYILGPEVEELETTLSAYVGVDHCIAVASGTDALLIALMALGVQAGDEVITTPFSFISTSETIALLGATPVYVDIDPVTYNLDPGKLEAVISKRTKAIIPVSLYGQPADFLTINAIADRYGLAVIEDGAQSFGSEQQGQRSCGLSTIGTTSFFLPSLLVVMAMAELASPMTLSWPIACGECPAMARPSAISTPTSVSMVGSTLFKQRFCWANGPTLRRKLRPVVRLVLPTAASFVTLESRPHHSWRRAIRACTPNTQCKWIIVRRCRLNSKNREFPQLCTHHAALSATSSGCDHSLCSGVCYTPIAQAASERRMSLPMHPWLSEADQDRVDGLVRALQQTMISAAA